MAEVRREKGAALIVALIALIVLSLLVVGVTTLAMSGSQLTVTNRDYAEALYVAESGIVHTMFEMPLKWKTPEAITRHGSSGAGDFTIESIVYCDEDGNPSLPGTQVAYVDVVATGKVTSAVAPDMAVRTIRSWLPPNWPSYWGHGIAALDDHTGPSKDPLKIGGGSTFDSYSSAAGDYESQMPGDVDLTSNGDATVGGNTTVNGNILPFGDLTRNGSGTSTGGGDGYLDEKVPAKDFDTALHAAEAENNNAAIQPSGVYKPATKELLSTNQLVTLPGGDKDAPKIYYFSKMTCRDSLQIGPAPSNPDETGYVIVYVEGDIDINTSNTVINPILPPRLLIFCTGTNVTVNGNATFYGAIYAPYAWIKLNGAGGSAFDFFGAIVGKHVDVGGNTDFHYDRELADERVGPPSGFTASKWLEEMPRR